VSSSRHCIVLLKTASHKRLNLQRNRVFTTALKHSKVESLAGSVSHWRAGPDEAIASLIGWATQVPVRFTTDGRMALWYTAGRLHGRVSGCAPSSSPDTHLRGLRCKYLHYLHSCQRIVRTTAELINYEYKLKAPILIDIGVWHLAVTTHELIKRIKPNY
ncbi:unnamed protein product, partial [Nesidiocoris tenuis]